MNETAAALAAPATAVRDQAEASMWRWAHAWYTGLELEHQGVSLGTALAYDLLRLQGALWKEFMDGQVSHA